MTTIIKTNASISPEPLILTLNITFYDGSYSGYFSPASIDYVKGMTTIIVKLSRIAIPIGMQTTIIFPALTDHTEGESQVSSFSVSEDGQSASFDLTISDTEPTDFRIQVKLTPIDSAPPTLLFFPLPDSYAQGHAQGHGLPPPWTPWY